MLQTMQTLYIVPLNTMLLPMIVIAKKTIARKETFNSVQKKIIVALTKMGTITESLFFDLLSIRRLKKTKMIPFSIKHNIYSTNLGIM